MPPPGDLPDPGIKPVSPALQANSLPLWLKFCGKESACNSDSQSLDWEDTLKKAMAPHSSTLAWRIPWTEEAGRLQSMGSLRVGHD